MQDPRQLNSFSETSSSFILFMCRIPEKILIFLVSRLQKLQWLRNIVAGSQYTKPENYVKFSVQKKKQKVIQQNKRVTKGHDYLSFITPAASSKTNGVE